MSKIIIGIDPGVKTGFAVWLPHLKKFARIETMKIHEAMKTIYQLMDYNELEVYIEDARLRKWFGPRSRQKLQGAGSVKRDCKIWDDFLKDEGIKYHMVHPMQGGTKLDKIQFEKITGWNKRTSEHSRDAAMLVFELR